MLVFVPPVKGVVVVVLAYQLYFGLVTPVEEAANVAGVPLQVLVPGAVIVAATA